MKASMAFLAFSPRFGWGKWNLVSSTNLLRLAAGYITKNDAPVLTVDLSMPFIGSNPRNSSGNHLYRR